MVVSGDVIHGVVLFWGGGELIWAWHIVLAKRSRWLTKLLDHCTQLTRTVQASKRAGPHEYSWVKSLLGRENWPVLIRIFIPPRVHENDVPSL